MFRGGTLDVGVSTSSGPIPSPHTEVEAKAQAQKRMPQRRIRMQPLLLWKRVLKAGFVKSKKNGTLLLGPRVKYTGLQLQRRLQNSHISLPTCLLVTAQCSLLNQGIPLLLNILPHLWSYLPVKRGRKWGSGVSSLSKEANKKANKTACGENTLSKEDTCQLW